jgi:Domain of unknown function (DUF4395)
MDDPRPQPQIDGRSARFELGAIAVVLLGGYVFGIVWVIPALAAFLAFGLGFGTRANLFHQLFQALVAGRLKAAPASGTETETESTVRFSELFAVVVLTIASLLYVVGVSPLAWLVALIEAGICALHATTGISVEGAVRRRIRGRRAQEP